MQSSWVPPLAVASTTKPADRRTPGPHQWANRPYHHDHQQQQLQPPPPGPRTPPGQPGPPPSQQQFYGSGQQGFMAQGQPNMQLLASVGQAHLPYGY